MVRNTSYHDWPFPEHGAEDYEFTFDDFVAELDADAVLTDTKTNRPSPGTTDRLYLASDESTLYRDTGSAWEVVGGKNLNFADLHNVNNIRFDTSNSPLQIRDQFDQIQMDFDGGGQVQVPNGTFDLGNNLQALSGNDLQIETAGGGTNYVSLYDANGAQDILRAHEGGNVEIPNGEVFVGSGARLGTDGSNAYVTAETAGGDVYLQGRDSNGSKVVALKGNDTGNVEVPNGDVIDGAGNVIFDQTNNWVPEAILENNAVTIAGNKVTLGNSVTPTLDDFGAAAGAVDFGGNNVTNVNDIINSSGVLSVGTDGTGSGIVQWLDHNASSRALYYQEGGNDVVIESPAGGLTYEPTSSGLADGGTIASLTATFRGYYDSDSTTTVSATAVDAELQHKAFSSGGSSLDVNVQNTRGLRVFDNGVVSVPSGEFQVTNSGSNIRAGVGVDIIFETDDSGTGEDQISAFQFVDQSTGNDINWTRDTASGYALKIRNKGTSNTLSIQHDSGDHELVTGNYVARNDAVIDPGSSGLSDGGSINSGLARLTGYYDSDGTTTVSASSVNADIQHVAYSDGTSDLDIRVQASDILRLNSSGNVDVPNGNHIVTDDGYRVYGSTNEWGVTRDSADNNLKWLQDPLGSPDLWMEFTTGSGGDIDFHKNTRFYGNVHNNSGFHQNDDYALVFGSNHHHHLYYDSANTRFLWEDQSGTSAVSHLEVPNGGTPNWLNGLQVGGSRVLTESDQNVVASGTVTLSSGSAVVSTGVTSSGTDLDVSLDPSGAGANTTLVSAAARVRWNGDLSTPEYEIEILEDGTNVGNPDIGYKVVAN